MDSRRLWSFHSFIKSDDSPLVNLIKIIVITFSIWIIWCMRNYARFQVKTDLSRAISTIKDFICLVGNSSRSSMRNDMFDFNMLKFFDINTCSGKVLHPLPVRWDHQVELKLILMLLLGVLLVLLVVVVFFVRVWEGGIYWWFLCFPWYSNFFGCWVLYNYTYHWRN